MSLETAAPASQWVLGQLVERVREADDERGTYDEPAQTWTDRPVPTASPVKFHKEM